MEPRTNSIAIKNQSTFSRLQRYLFAMQAELSVQQSRLAINVDNESRVKIKFEFDLDGEAGNTIGISSSNNGFFRARLANLVYKVSEQATMTVGKKWDGRHDYIKSRMEN